MPPEVKYDILYPSGKQINGVAPSALKKAISDKKLPEGTKVRKAPDGNWSTLKNQSPTSPPPEPAPVAPPEPIKEPEPTVPSIQLPEPLTRVLCMLPEGSAPDVQVFKGSDGKFDIFQGGKELCSVPTWEAALNLVKAIQPAPVAANVVPKKKAKGMIETMFPDALDYRDGGGLYRSDTPPPKPQQTQVINNIHVHSGNKGIGILLELFLTPFTGFLLGGLGASVAGRGNGSLFIGLMLWVIAAVCAVPTVGMSYFIFLPIMLFKWAVDVVSCLLAK